MAVQTCSIVGAVLFVARGHRGRRPPRRPARAQPQGVARCLGHHRPPGHAHEVGKQRARRPVTACSTRCSTAPAAGRAPVSRAARPTAWPGSLDIAGNPAAWTVERIMGAKGIRRSSSARASASLLRRLLD